MAIATAQENPIQGDLEPGCPEYLLILKRYRDMDPALVRLSVNETALITGLAKKTLEAKRAKGQEPAFLKIGRRIEYRLLDVRNFVESSRFQSTREAKTSRRTKELKRRPQTSESPGLRDRGSQVQHDTDKTRRGTNHARSGK